MNGFWPAVAWLWWRTFANRVRRQLRRAREPRYAVGLFAALCYVALGFARWTGDATVRGHAGAETAFVLLAVAGLASAWIFGGDEAVLRFTEAEVQALFPAPVGRRTLVAYKVVRAAWAALPYALLSTVFVGGRVTRHRELFALGAWIGFATMDLHLAAASLTRAMVVDLGIAGLRRRVLTLLGLAGVLAALVFGASRVEPFPVEPDPTAWVDWVVDATSRGPLGLVLWPIRAPLDVAFAPTVADALRALPGALLVLGLHAAWVLSTGVAFEDASVAAAERRAARMASVRRGTSPVRLGGFALPLASTGRPEVALVWKGVLGAFRLGSVRLGLVVGAMAVVFAVALAQAHDASAALVGAALSLLIAAYLAVFGAGLLRVDLRLDLARHDVLRAMPLSGRSIVIGELLGPWVVLAGIEVLCVAAAVGLAAADPRAPGWVPRIAVGLALAVAFPVATACGLAVQNAAALLYPGDDDQVGLEAVGRRLVTQLTSLVLVAIGVIPAAIAAVPVLLLQRWLGALVYPLAAVVGAAPVAGLLWWATARMGSWLERYGDP